ncbi:MAG: heme exporter protein CcmB [Sedimentisphaerales bacterium]|nr:heme exporter protein CcmB [Sedimentisphaerales bacterium]
MNSFCHSVRTILAKDLLTELRAKQVLPTMVILGVLIAWIFRIVAEPVAVSSSATAAAVLLLATLFSTILSSERIFAIEQNNSCISALLVSPVEPGDIYIAKTLASIVMLSIFDAFVVPAVLILFNINIIDRLSEFIIALLLLNIGISAVATFFACLVQQTKGSNLLLSILVMVTLCPIMVPATFALLAVLETANHTGNMEFLHTTISFKTAVGFIAAFDIIFVTICWLLFGIVLTEEPE